MHLNLNVYSVYFCVAVIDVIKFMILQLLIENANAIGVLPEHIIERIAMSTSSGSVSDEETAAKKKKKRRSGSLTRNVVILAL